MQKPKTYDWRDSNLALFGSDTEKAVKKESAESEPAWQGAGEDVGLQIWRIVKFHVTHWDKDQYGELFSGDSYIVLNTYKEEDSDELMHDVHFWIGKHSTQDEYGTAAYKTVELDTFLDDKPIQHREVQGHESALFKSYFPTMTILKGGSDTGFRKVKPEAYSPRLMHVKKENKKITSTQVSMKRGNVTSKDVFILDLGLTIYVWHGNECSADEKFKAVQEADKIRAARGGKPKIESIDEDNGDERFFSHLKEGTSKKGNDDMPETGSKKLMKLSDETGEDFQEIAEGDDVKKDLLTSDDVFMFDTTKTCFVYVGDSASVDEKRNSLSRACNYVNKTEHPWLPIVVLTQAQSEKCEEFVAAFAA